MKLNDLRMPVLLTELRKYREKANFEGDWTADIQCLSISDDGTWKGNG